MASSSVPDVVEFALALLASGALAGLLAGLFGASGGLVIVPVLHPLFTTLGMHNSIVVHMAAGMSLALVALTAGRAVLLHRSERAATRVWLWPIPAGAVAASVVVAALPGPQTEIVFTVAVLAGAMKMLFFGASVPFSVLAGAGGGVMAGDGALAGMADRDVAPFGRDVAASIGPRCRATLDRLRRVVDWCGHSPAVICALMAIPGALGLAMAGFGEPRLPTGLAGYFNALGVLVILITATVLAPVGAELSGQFPKRVLEVSFGAFLLLVASEFAVSLLS